MIRVLLVSSLGLAIVVLGIIRSSWAEVVSPEPSDLLIQPTSSELSELSEPPTPPEPSTQSVPVQIINVQVTSTSDGLQLRLQTSDRATLQPTRMQTGNQVIVDIPNAQLQGQMREDAWRQENLTPEITAIEVIQLDANTVRVTVTGTTTAPMVEWTIDSQGLLLSVIPVVNDAAEALEPPVSPPVSPPDASSDASPTVPPPSPNAIRIIVTGDQETYRVSESSVGTRTDTDILDVPQSIQVIPDEVIEDQGIRSLGDVARNTAGVSTGRISSDSLATEFVIRGFPTENILRNGLRDTTQQFASSIDNVEQIEVLRGPASVLFGQGSLGGTVNLVTEEPLEAPAYSLEYAGGQFNLYRPAIDFSSPFSPVSPLGYRFNATYENSGSFRDFEDSSYLFLAPTVTLIDTDNTNLIADLEYLRFQSSGTAPELPASGTVVDNPNGELDRTVNLGEPSLSESDSVITRLSYRLEHRFNANWRIRNEFLAAFSEVSLNRGVIPVELLSDQRTLRRVITENPSNLSNYTLNTNLIGQFATGIFDHELLVGVELFRDTQRDTIDIINVATIDIFDPEYSGSALNLLERQDTRTFRNSVGIYLQDQISFSDHLILVLGGRFDFVNLEFENLLRAEDNFASEEQAFSPRIGIVYKPEETISLYASYTRSFEPVVGREQLFDSDNNQIILGDPFEPERGTQYEVGIKADLFDERLSVTLALYQLERTNVTTTGPDSSFSRVQVGEQRSQGVELNVVGEILPGWNLLASYAYTDARITDDNQYEIGNRLPNAPEHAASLWTTYEIQSGTLQGLGLGFGLFFQSERVGDLNNSFRLPSYLRTDAALFYRRDRFRASLNLQNLFDVEYYTGSRDNTDVRVVVGAPLTISGQISWEF